MQVVVVKHYDVSGMEDSSQDETGLLLRLTDFIVMSVDSQPRVAFITHKTDMNSIKMS
jgi:hypothetical protein